MSTLKTKALPKKVSASGTLKVMQKLNEYEFGVELWVLREGENRNKWDYRNLRDYYKTFIGQPILIAYVGQQVGGRTQHEQAPGSQDRGGVPILHGGDGRTHRGNAVR